MVRDFITTNTSKTSIHTKGYFFKTEMSEAQKPCHKIRSVGASHAESFFEAREALLATSSF